MWRKPSFCAAALAAVFGMNAAVAQVRSVELRAPRSFGYVIGDEVRLQADVTVDGAYEIVLASIPQPRQVTYWLNLKSVAVEERRGRRGATLHRFHLTYQTFYAPLGARDLEIPAWTVELAHGANRVEARVPPWHFVMSPLRGLDPHKREDSVAIRGDVAPIRASLARAGVTGLCSAVALLLSGLLLAHHFGSWPFARRAGRPFAHCARSVRIAPEQRDLPGRYAMDLLCLHRAFDEAAGQRVLADDVERFIDRNPRFSALAADIRSFFQASREAFFGDDIDGAMATLPPAQLKLLAARLAAVERMAT